MLEDFGKIHSLFDTPNEHLSEHSTEHLSEHPSERDYLYISITYEIVNEHLSERSSEHHSEHLSERYLTNFTTSSRTYLLRPAILNPNDLSNSIKYHL